MCNLCTVEALHYTTLRVDWSMMTSPLQGCAETSPWQPVCTIIGFPSSDCAETSQGDSHLFKCSDCGERQVSPAELKQEVVKDFPRRRGVLQTSVKQLGQTMMLLQWKTSGWIIWSILLEISLKSRYSSLTIIKWRNLIFILNLWP